MRNRLVIEFFGILLSFGALWFFFTWLDLAPKVKPLAFSVEQEQKLGDVLVDATLSTSDTLESDVVRAAVDSVFFRLHSSLDSSKYQYHIYIVKSDEINALTLPGGNIIIFSGLLNFVDSPEQLAAIIAHEMGHVENRDVVFRLTRELGLNIVLSALFNGDNNVIKQINKTVISTAFSREEESRADSYAFKLLVKSKLKPSALASFFSKLDNEKGSTYNKNLEFLMTHPHDQKRISAALTYPLPKNFIEAKFSNVNWVEVKKEIEQHESSN